MKIEFECTHNIALLMIAFHGIVTNDEPDDVIASQDYFGWIIDELGIKAHSWRKYLEEEMGIEIDAGMKALVDYYEKIIPSDDSV